MARGPGTRLPSTSRQVGRGGALSPGALASATIQAPGTPVQMSAPYLSIADALRDEIASKRLPPHSRLPSEQELVQRYKVARETLRKALAKLEQDGLVYRRRAVGTFVAEPR